MRGLCTLTDPVHDLVGTFCKMVFDIFEKDFIVIAGLHEVFSGIDFVEHDFGSYGEGLRFDSSRHVRGSYGYAESILIASDATLS
jgi:hypothetical protein